MSQGGGRYLFLGRVRLSPLAKNTRLAVAFAALAAIAGLSINGYLKSPTHRAEVAVREATVLERAGKVDEALERHERAVRELAGEEEAVVGPSAEAIIRLQVGKVSEPFQPAALDDAMRIVKRYATLPVSARTAAGQVLLDALERWAGQVGDATELARETKLRLLEEGRRQATGKDLARFDASLAELRLGLARGLEVDWPVEALDLYARAGDQGLAPAAAILTALAEQPSLLAEERTLVDGLTAALAKDPKLAPAAEKAKAALAHAAELQADEARKAALASGDEAALAALAAKSPWDQDVAVARAASRWSAGKPKEARALLAAFGKPGLLVPSGRYLLASMAHMEGQPVDASRILERTLAGRLPAFQRAQQEFEEAIQRVERQLVSQARTSVPTDLERKLQGLDEARQREAFREWLDERVRSSPTVVEARDQYAALHDVVPAAVLLGTVKLELARAASGGERDELLRDAEHAFLSIRQSAEGDPRFHLGLGQVYHRIGRHEEGDKELDAILATDDRHQHLAVADAYRDLGLVAKATTVAKKVFERGSTEERYGAAALLAMLVTTTEERRDWFQKGNPKSPFVITGLLEVEGALLVRAGKLQEADAKFAKAAEIHLRSAEVNGASANNLALTLGQRYVCTGDPAFLAEAERRLDASRRLDPDSAIVLSNLGEVLEHEAQIATLGHWVHTRDLMLSSQEADALVGLLLDGPLREQVLATLRSEAHRQRAQALNQQQEALAPAAPSRSPARKDGRTKRGTARCSRASRLGFGRRRSSTRARPTSACGLG